MLTKGNPEYTVIITKEIQTMGLQTEKSLHDDVLGLTREGALEAHISMNFFPPHPGYVKKSIVEGFKKYWAGEIGLEELAKACY